MSVEGARETEDVVNCLYNYLEEHCIFQLEKLEEKAENENIDGAMKEWIGIITECLMYLYQGSYIGVFRQFKKSLQKNVSVNTSGHGERKKPDSNMVCVYAAYCYLVRLSVFNAIYQGLPGGWSYDMFVENIYNENAISGEWKGESQKYRKYLSDIKLQKKDYIKTILSIRRNHRGLSDKNKNNRKWEYESIPPYKRMGQEFEFFMKKRNRTSKNGIEQEQIEFLRKQRIEPLLSKQGIDLSTYQNEYAKLKKMQIGEMPWLELRQYLKYIRAKKDYVYKYTESYFYTAEILAIEEDLLLNNFEIYGILDILNANGLDGKTVLQDLQAIGYVIWMIIDRRYKDNCKCPERGSILWDSVIQLLNCVDAELDKDLLGIGNVKNLPDFHKAWKTVPMLCIDESIKTIQEKFINSLVINDTALEDYIKFSILTKYIIPDEIMVHKLKAGFIPVSQFLQICKEKSFNQNDIDIEDELLQLKELLKKEGIDLNIEKMETLYESRIYRQYFSDCLEKQYIHLYEIIESLLLDNGELNERQVIQKYMDSVLPEFADENTKLPKFVKQSTAEFIFYELIDCLYPNRLAYGDVDKIYDVKGHILDIAQKYDLVNILGF